jgi:hypothetical protein
MLEARLRCTTASRRSMPAFWSSVAPSAFDAFASPLLAAVGGARVRHSRRLFGGRHHLVVLVVNRATTHVLHEPCGVVAGSSRSEPVRSVKNCLLQPVIPGRSRSEPVAPCRPVTPEVAGSSPVAPVKVPAKWHVVLAVLAPGLGRPHTPFRAEARRRAKRTNTRVRAQEFTRIQRELRAAHEAASPHKE